MVTTQSHTDNDIKVFNFHIEDAEPGVMSGLMKLSNDLSDRFILLMDKANYVEPYSQNVTVLTIIGDESYLTLRKTSVTSDRFYKTDEDGTVFGHEIDYLITNNIASGSDITLTFLRLKTDCEPDACNN